MKCRHCNYESNSVIAMRKHLYEEHEIKRNLLGLFVKKILAKLGL
jgi:hypothetical protein